MKNNGWDIESAYEELAAENSRNLFPPKKKVLPEFLSAQARKNCTQAYVCIGVAVITEHVKQR